MTNIVYKLSLQLAQAFTNRHVVKWNSLLQIYFFIIELTEWHSRYVFQFLNIWFLRGNDQYDHISSPNSICLWKYIFDSNKNSFAASLLLLQLSK